MLRILLSSLQFTAMTDNTGCNMHFDPHASRILKRSWTLVLAHYQCVYNQGILPGGIPTQPPLTRFSHFDLQFFTT